MLESSVECKIRCYGNVVRRNLAVRKCHVLRQKFQFRRLKDPDRVQLLIPDVVETEGSNGVIVMGSVTVRYIRFIALSQEAVTKI